MKSSLSEIVNIRILPRWIIVIIDISLSFFAIIFAYLLRFNFDLTAIELSRYFEGVPLFVAFCFLVSMITKSYSGIIRFTGLQDGIRIVITTGVASIIVAIVNFTVIYLGNQSVIPYSIIVIGFMTSSILLITYRLLVKAAFSYYKGGGVIASNMIIFGAGDSGQITKQIFSSKPNVKVVGFLEDDVTKIDKVINGVRIYDGKNELALLLKLLNVQELIISVQELDVARKSELINEAISSGVKVRHVPPVSQWINGELSTNQIRDVKIEDLLGRESIKVDNYYVQEELEGKKILITGAAGSIGSEIVRQLISLKPSHLILYDQSESAIYNLQNELIFFDKDIKISYIIGDVVNKDKLEYVFREYKPELVFHAAAYKHVPLMEVNATEAVMCNIQGTCNLSTMSVSYGVKKFVYISTDKAVNPTNIMGATKRIGEMFIQSLNSAQLNGSTVKTKFITTRFGNVLGSNGSVIPLFKEQIAKGGPITITHPEITRYFMTIPEACQLVLEAAVMGKGGEVFIFDMGKSVKIIDLADKMIRLSGLKPNEDIDIIYTGLRKGEKLYEELLTDVDNTLPTYHNKIMIAKIIQQDYDRVKKEVSTIINLAISNKELEMVQHMKSLVPEYISNSSKFQSLDKNVVSKLL